MIEKIYTIKVIPNSKINKIVEQDESFLKIKLTAPATDNKANKALLDFLAKEFKISKKNIIIIKGNKNRNKSIKITSS
ncbi:DUF167 domain-containing protein [Patescibacteria group bacterium]